MPTVIPYDAPPLGVPMPGPFVGVWPALRRGVTLLWPLLALALLLAYNYYYTPNFFQLLYREDTHRYYGRLIDILNRGTPVMIVAMGMALVIGTGGIDLSVGSVMAITGMVAATLISQPDTALLHGLSTFNSLTVVLLIGMAFALLAGLWNGVLVAYLGIQPIIATLILMVSGRGIAQLFNNGQNAGINGLPAFASLGTGGFFYLPIPVWVGLGVVLFTVLLTRGTALGLFIESVGNSPSASRFAGVNEKLVKLVAYTFCSLCAGLAGMIAVADVGEANANNVGLNLELDAILAVAIGGTALTGGRFSLLGAVLGALIIQTLTTTILSNSDTPEWTQVIKGGVVIGVCLLQSTVLRSRVLGLVKRRPA